MVEITTMVQNKTGLHARPAAQLVALAKTFQSKVTVLADGRSCDAKSIFSVLHACIKQGTEVVVRAEGADEQAAAEGVVKYIEALEE